MSIKSLPTILLATATALAVSPDGTQMALYASPKDAYSDLSLPLFVAPVTGGDATQITRITKDVPGVVRILGGTQ